MLATQHRILIADDHVVFRAGLKLVLKSQSILDVEEAADCGEMLQKLSRGNFTAAMIDLDMPGMDSGATLAKLRGAFPELILIVISALEDEAEIAEVRAAGIEAFVPKSWNLEEMLSEIQRVLSQGEAVSAPGQVSLTTRQREVLERVERGLSNKEIAIDLGIAPNTVKIHMSALFSLFGAHNRTQLLLRAKSHL
jgi:DNA-binding NarL/FixJ family response regulator